MEWALMVVAIVGIVTYAKTYRAKHGIGCEYQESGAGRRDHPEAAALRDEVRALKERIAVLERITVEKENTLARQIDELRDR